MKTLRQMPLTTPEEIIAFRREALRLIDKTIEEEAGKIKDQLYSQNALQNQAYARQQLLGDGPLLNPLGAGQNLGGLWDLGRRW